MLNLLMRHPLIFSVLFAVCSGVHLNASAQDLAVATKPQRFLYVAAPGIRNYLEYGGHGLIVFDIDNHHTFVKRIPTGGLGSDGTPLNVKGICASSSTGRLYISTIETLQCIDETGAAVMSEKIVEVQFANGKIVRTGDQFGVGRVLAESTR